MRIDTTREYVQAMRERLPCDCGGEYTGKGTKGMGVKLSSPPMYPHKCDSCGDRTWVRGKQYPRIVYVDG